ITPSFFSYNNIDSTQGFIARKHIVIPSSARNGWNFAIQYTVHAPKTMDTVGMAFYFQGVNNCAGLGGSYVPEPSACGVPCGALTSINTFQEGNWWFTKKGNLGDNTSLSWPITAAGPAQGFYENVGNEYWAPLSAALLSCCTGCAGDTLQYDVQDLAITPYVNTTPTGINSINTSGLSVAQNYPNPFNKTTQITYTLTKSSDVTFSVYDMTGRVLVNNVYTNSTPGKHEINLNANTFSPGVYFYTFNVNGSTVTKKMVITE
ncbi:MAG TPA: T9SS type A sorting domain-containing protein, partial [Bacteroidia bacterium]|nr:T9SS type A sorting domain-containing protein [Bacteroidia bacterium]